MGVILTTKIFMDKPVCFMLQGMGNLRFANFFPNMAVTCFIKTKTELKHLILLESKDIRILLSFLIRLNLRKRWKKKNQQGIQVWIRKRKRRRLREMSIVWLIVMKMDRLSSWVTNSCYNFQEQANWMKTFFKCYAIHN